MGASFYWQPFNNGKYISIGLRSQFLNLMSNEFGEYPWILFTNDSKALRAIANEIEDDLIKAALNMLADNCELYEKIVVWPEY